MYAIVQSNNCEVLWKKVAPLFLLHFFPSVYSRRVKQKHSSRTKPLWHICKAKGTRSHFVTEQKKHNPRRWVSGHCGKQGKTARGRQVLFQPIQNKTQFTRLHYTRCHLKCNKSYNVHLKYVFFTILPRRCGPAH